MLLIGVVFIKHAVVDDGVDCDWFSLLFGTEEGVSVERILRSVVVGSSEELRLNGEICMPETVRGRSEGRSYC
jgi:hypothetical protein